MTIPKKTKMKLPAQRTRVPDISEEDVEKFAAGAETELQKKKPVKEVKKRPKNVRDTFTMPEGDFNLIEKMRIRAMMKGIDRNKSEMVRAGLIALDNMGEKEFENVILKVTRTKRGCK